MNGQSAIQTAGDTFPILLTSHVKSNVRTKTANCINDARMTIRLPSDTLYEVAAGFRDCLGLSGFREEASAPFADELALSLAEAERRIGGGDLGV